MARVCGTIWGQYAYILRPLFWVFEAMISIGVILWPMAGSIEHLESLTIYGVFIIPAVVGIVMLYMTAGEISEIHRRFNSIDHKLNKLDTIESLLKELVEHVKKGNHP